VGGILPHARNRIIEHGRYRGNRLRIRAVIEDLDAPPADTGIRIAESLNERFEHPPRRTEAPEVRHRDSAHQRSERSKLGLS